MIFFELSTIFLAYDVGRWKYFILKISLFVTPHWPCTRFNHFMCNFSPCLVSTGAKFMNSSGYCNVTDINLKKREKTKCKVKNGREEKKGDMSNNKPVSQPFTHSASQPASQQISGHNSIPTLLNHCCHFLALYVCNQTSTWNSRANNEF